MINIGYFSHSNISTSETFIFDLIKGLALYRDFDVTFISGQKKAGTPLPNIQTINVGFADAHPKLVVRAYKIGQLRNKGEDLQLATEKWSANKALNKCKLPNIDVAYIEYATTAVLVYDYLLSKRIPYIIHVHGYDITSSLNNAAYKKEALKVLKGAKYIVAASYYIRNLLILLGCEEDMIKVIRLGVDTDKITPLKWEVRKTTQPSIIYLGRLTPKKHPIALLHTFSIVKKRIPKAKLTIIGDGELAFEVEERIQQLGLSESVTMLGALPREKAFPVLNTHWIYAQHSVTASSGDQEGFGISLAEAAAHELPVVSTLHNGIPENVINGETGFLVKEFDFEDMAEKIIYLIQNPTIAEKMGKAGRKHVQKLCPPNKRIEEIKKLILIAASQEHKKYI